MIDKDEKVFGYLDSNKNPELEKAGLLVVATKEGKRYFRYNGYPHWSCVPTFVECNVMSCSCSEVEHDSNDRASVESA